MINHAKAVIARSPSTFVQDALGAVALMVMLVGSLHLPSLM